jgi:Protein of unknown function (DUF3035)
MRRITLLTLAALSLVPLAGCDTLRRDAGLTKQSPDEFAVVTKAPLIIPPNFNLQPPAPGAPPLNQQGPTDTAQAALFETNDTQLAAQSFKGSYSPGERMLLAGAGAQNSDPSIRAELDADDRTAAAAADQSFTDKVLNGSVEPAAKPSNKKPVVAPKKEESGGLFDWF